MDIERIGNNETAVYINGKCIFYSYNTAVAGHAGGTLYKVNRFYSVTTSKHVNRWLDGREYTAVTEEEFKRIFDL